MTDALTELEGLLQHAQEVAERLQFGDALEHAKEQLGEHDDLPDRVAQLAAVAAYLEPLPAEVAQTKVTLSTRLSESATEIEAISDGEGLKKIQHPLREASSAAQSLQTTLTTQWNARIRERFEPLATVGQVLESIESTRAFGSELKQWARTAPSSRGNAQWSPQPADLDVIRKMDADLGRRRESLHTAGIDEDVQTFLLAVSRGGATLSDVDAKVLAWLKSNKAATRFAITAISSSQQAPKGGRAPSG